MLRALALGLASSCAFGPLHAAAQSSGACDQVADPRGDDVIVHPADEAEGVARDAPIVARYAAQDLDSLRDSVAADADAECRGHVICVFALRGSGPRAERSAVAGQEQALDAHSVAFVADEPFAADSDYFALLARPGFDNASRHEVDFHTGSAFDREPPQLDVGADALELDVEPPPSECDAPEGSLRVRVAVPAVHDDGDEESVELLLFLTRAEGLRGPDLRARAPNQPGHDVELTFTLDPLEATGSVCVALRAQDGSGKLSDGEPELCFEPEAARSSQFVSLCAASRVHDGADNGRGLLVASAFAVAALVRRSTRRSRSRAHP